MSKYKWGGCERKTLTPILPHLSCGRGKTCLSSTDEAYIHQCRFKSSSLVYSDATFFVFLHCRWKCSTYLYLLVLMLTHVLNFLCRQHLPSHKNALGLLTQKSWPTSASIKKAKNKKTDSSKRSV